jgi:acetate kinase
MKILVLNTGSSTVKFSSIESDGEQVLLDGQADWSSHPARLVLRREGSRPAESTLEAVGHGAAITHILGRLHQNDRGIVGVGHRVVHGGSIYTSSVRITPEVTAQLAKLTEIAPHSCPYSAR